MELQSRGILWLVKQSLHIFFLVFLQTRSVQHLSDTFPPSLTSSLGYNLQVLGQGPVSYRGEGQHSDVISLVRSQTLDGDEVGAAHHLLLPLHNTSTRRDARMQADTQMHTQVWDTCRQVICHLWFIRAATKLSTHLVDWQHVVWCVVHSVAHHLSVWFLWFIPVNDCCCGAQHTTSDLQGKQDELI